LFAATVILFHGWAAMALSIDGPTSVWLARGLIASQLVAGILLCWFRWPKPGAVAAGLVPALVVLVWWLSIPASNDREWLDESEFPAAANIEGDILTIRNVRNFDYRSNDDYTPRWETRTYDLSKLRGIDFIMSTWGSPLIAHTIASWDFGEGQYLAISIETRKEVGEEYSAILGFFRQFELYYVVADERDVIRVRANFRDEDVRLYHLTTRPEIAKAILLDYLEEVNRLAENPAWYNAFSQNCTTSIRHHVQHVMPSGLPNWRVFVNGFLDELGYEKGRLDTSLPFEELREKSRVSARSKAMPEGANYSEWIREGLPGSRD
jgi:hypothetical protein